MADRLEITVDVRAHRHQPGMHAVADRLEITVDEQGRGVSADALRVLLNQTLTFLKNEPGGHEGVTWRVTGASLSSRLHSRSSGN